MSTQYCVYRSFHKCISCLHILMRLGIRGHFCTTRTRVASAGCAETSIRAQWIDNQQYTQYNVKLSPCQCCCDPERSLLWQPTLINGLIQPSANSAQPQNPVPVPSKQLS